MAPVGRDPAGLGAMPLSMGEAWGRDDSPEHLRRAVEASLLGQGGLGRIEGQFD